MPLYIIIPYSIISIVILYYSLILVDKILNPEKIKPMTRTDLEQALSQIGWKINKSVDGQNDWLINDKNQTTKIKIIANHFHIGKGCLFGKDGIGDILISFENCDLDTFKIKDIVTVWIKGINSFIKLERIEPP